MKVRLTTVITVMGMAVLILLTGCTAINSPPVASFTRSPSFGECPLSVSFNASASRDSDGSIVSYGWTFGDGGSGTGVTTSHTYQNAGTYVAVLRVTDNDGSTDTATRTISVSGPEFGGVGDTISNGYVRITLRGVRSSPSLGSWCNPDPGQIFVIADLKVECVSGSRYISKLPFTLVQNDGRAQDGYNCGSWTLDHPLESIDLSAGQWTDGEIAFEVYPSSPYTLIYDYEPLFHEEDPIKFRFTP